ncbi:MAG: polyprenyl diphosphate synthase [Bacteroidota bacterium]
MQSYLTTTTRLHLACIMDGNGRWATRRERPRTDGHRAGVEAVRRVVEAAPGLGVSTLTLYAFSADNWKRPEAEVSALMALFRWALRREIVRLKRAGVRLSVIGRRDRLPEALRNAIARGEWETRRGTRLHLRIAVDYSARDALVEAARRCQTSGEALPCDDSARDAFARHLAAAMHPHVLPGEQAPDVDLVVRTAGEQRLSDFLLWECAYAEFAFLDRCWPEMDADALAAVLADFRSRTRKFGALPGGPAGTLAEAA